IQRRPSGGADPAHAFVQVRWLVVFRARLAGGRVVAFGHLLPLRSGDRGLLVAAAGELGDDPAGGEGHAERRDRALADQVGGAVDQVAALVHQLVDLFARGAGAFLERGDARQRAVGQFRLHLRPAQAHFVAGDAGRAADRVAGVAGGLLEVVAGLAEVALEVVGVGGVHLGLRVGGRTVAPMIADAGLATRDAGRRRGLSASA